MADDGDVTETGNCRRIVHDRLFTEKNYKRARGMSDSDEHFVEFSIGVEWKIAQEDKVGGVFQIECPMSFPLDANVFRIPVKRHASSRETLVDTCVDDFFVDCAFRNSFLFKLRFSPNRKGDEFTEETVLLDASALFMRGKKEEKVEVAMKGFESVVFDVKIDEDLLSEAHLKRFCPAFFYISTIDNMPPLEDGADFAPVYVTCKVANRVYNLLVRRGKKCAVETAIVVAPRTESMVVIEVHDRERVLPAIDQFRGSGVYVPFAKETVPALDLDRESSSSSRRRSPRSPRHKLKEVREEIEVPQDIEIVNPTDAEDNEEEEFTEVLKTPSPRQNEASFVVPEKKKTHTSPVPFVPRNRPFIQPMKPERPPSQQKLETKNTTPPKKKRRRVKKQIEEEKVEEKKVEETKPKKSDASVGFGVASCQLLPERNHRCEVKPSDTGNSSGFQNTFVYGRTWDPAQNYPAPTNLAPVPRPSKTKKRPVPTETNQQDSDKEDPRILALEPRTSKLVRWIVTCHRDSACSLDLQNLIRDYHKSVIPQWNSQDMPSFQWGFRQCADLITGFHFVSPKEEIFVLESRWDRKTKATKRLDDFLKTLPNTTHVLGNINHTFKAPRLYCCFDRLVKRVEVPIPLDEMLQIKGLYFVRRDNHKIFSVSQKLQNLMQSKTLIEAVNSKSFPTYSEIKMLLRRAPGLYSMPLDQAFSIAPRPEVCYGHFGEAMEESPVIPLNSPRDVSDMIAQIMPPVFAPPEPEKPAASKEKERLTRYVLTRPQPRKEPSTRPVTIQTFQYQSVAPVADGKRASVAEPQANLPVRPPTEPKPGPRRKTARCKSARRFPAAVEAANTKDTNQSTDVRRRRRL